ncbi:MAG: hypothetical protein JXR95_09870, partial [Deltaproteobacteria bacterium]|nr:hypothetical protein [Deltaproteobacteria bacterium]
FKYIEGKLLFDSQPRGGCKKPSPECKTINVTEFLRDVSLAAQKSGIEISGFGLHSCSDREGKNTDLNTSLKVIRINNWKYASPLSKILIKKIRQWNLLDKIYINIAEIPGHCLL